MEALRLESKQMDQAAASSAARLRYLKSTKQRLFESKKCRIAKLMLI